MSLRGPMPTVTFDGRTMKVRSRSTEIPDLAAMPRMEAIVWLLRHTYPAGYSKPNPLAGMGSVISVETNRE